MILIKTYQDYIIKSFLKYILIIFGIFTCLIFILNVLKYRRIDISLVGFIYAL